MKIIKFLISIIIITLLGACTPTIPVPTATSIATPVIYLPTPNFWPCEILSTAQVTEEILRISGTESVESNTFKLDTETTLRLYWNQASQGNFSLLVANQDPAQSGTPFGEVTFEVIAGPSSGCGDYRFIAGEYKIVIRTEGEPWEVWAQAIASAGE